MNELKSPDKPFEISKWAVQEAWEKVKANKGAPGVDGVSIEGFEADLHNNLYKVWNRMSSGSYFPPPVRAVEIPKPHGGGTRMLGVTHTHAAHGLLPLARSQTRTGSVASGLLPFHAEAADRARVASMPDTTWPVSGHPPGSSRDP